MFYLLSISRDQLGKKVTSCDIVGRNNRHTCQNIQESFSVRIFMAILVDFFVICSFSIQNILGKVFLLNSIQFKILATKCGINWAIDYKTACKGFCSRQTRC